MKKLLVFSLCLILGLQSCSDKEDWNKNGIVSSDKAALELKLTSSGNFTSPTSKSSNTKATVDVNDFIVKILKGDAVVKEYDSYGSMPSVIELEPGDYTMEAGSKDDKEAAFDQPIYKGSQDLRLSAGKVTAVNIECKLSNIKFTIICSEGFYRELKDDFAFVVSNDNGILTFDKNAILEGKAGYFKSGPITVNLKAYRVLANSEVLFYYKIENAVAQDHHILTFDVKETGQIELPNGGIVVDYNVNNREVDIVIPGEDEEPIDPVDPPVDPVDPPVDPVDPPADDYLPTVVGNGIGTPISLSNAQADNSPVVEVTINTLNNKTIQKLIVEIDSPYLTEEFLAGVGMPSKFDLANFTEDAAGETL